MKAKKNTTIGKLPRETLDTRALKGALTSKKGNGMSFSEIREAAAKAARGRAFSEAL